MKKYNCSFLFFILSILGYSQIPNLTPSPQSIARTSVADTKSWTAFNNPAILGYTEQIELASTFENRYLIKELSINSIQITIPTKNLNIGAGFSFFGYSLYHEMLAGIDLSRNFSNKFSLGLGFDAYTVYYESSNSYKGAFLVRLGTSIKLSPTFSIGFSSFNTFQNSLKKEYTTSRIPSVFSLGTEYYFNNDFVWRTQIDKELSSNFRFSTGFEYNMLDFIDIKIGAYVFDRFIPCLGIGVQLKDFKTNLNCELNPQLGICTMLNLRYTIKKQLKQ